MSTTLNHLINGKSVPGTDYFESINPATQEVLAEVATGGDANLIPQAGGEAGLTAAEQAVLVHDEHA